jgi:hypothetical protein
MGLAKRLFGASRKEIWRKLSEEVGGRYVDGGFWKGDKVQVEHEDWTVTLDSYAVSTGKVTIVYTRMRAPFVNPAGFRFLVYRKSIFTGLGKFFGMQDIEVGDSLFDEDFVVQSTDEAKIRILLSAPKLRELISAQKDINFGVKDDEGWFGTKFPDGVDELHFVRTGIIKDVERLKLLYELFAETLDELCRIGAASQRPAGVEIK